MVLGMRKAGLTVVAVMAGATLLGGGCSTDREVTTPDPVPVTDKRLDAALLTEDDLPASFAAADEGTPINTEIIPEHECDDAMKDLDPEVTSSADFTSGNVVLSNSIGWFPGHGRDVEQLIKDIEDDCEAVVVADEDLSLRTSPLDFGVLSNDTLALKVEAELANGTIEERDLILIRDGDLVSMIRLTGPRPSDKELLDSVTRVALGRLGLLAEETS